MVNLLIIGGESDMNTQRIVDQAAIRDLDYMFWDTDLPGADQVAWSFQDDLLRLGDERLRPDAIYMRANVFGGDPASNSRVHDTIRGYVLAKPGVRCLNSRTLTDTNNKAFNLQLGADVGFEIPETLVMANTSPLETHPDPESRIVKPLNGGEHAATILKFLNDVASGEGRMSAAVGTQLVQSKLDGENMRVFSINQQLFAFHIATSEVDYREDKGAKIHEMEVPPQLVAGTHELVKKIGFDYCALDFRFKSDFDDPVFLEVNSFPMMVGFDNACENKLADEVLAFLTA